MSTFNRWITRVLATVLVLAAQTVTGADTPVPVSARSLSSHFLEVRFSSPAGPEWSNAAAYRINAPDGSPLAVESVQIGADGTTAMLTTGPQQAVEYRLAVKDARSAARLARKCQARQLRAARSLARANLACWSRWAANAAKDVGQSKAQACAAKARGRFAKAQAAAVAAASKKGGSCELVGSADGFVDRLMVSPLDHLRTAELLIGFDPATDGRAAARFRAALLRAAGAFSANLFGAESKNAGGLAETQVTLDKLGTRRAASRSRFDAQVARARARAAQAGLATPSPVDGSRAANTIEALVAGFVDATTPRIRLTLQGAPDDATVVFDGSDAVEPALLGAAAASATEVIVSFSTGMDRATAESPGLYQIAPGLAVQAAQLLASGRDVRLTTAAQEPIEYTLRVGALEGAPVDGRKLTVDPDHRMATFFGVGPGDTTAPRLLNAASVSATAVSLSFSELVGLGANDPTLYRVVGPNGAPLTVTAAELAAGGTQVKLTTEPQTPLVEYTVTVLDAADVGPQREPLVDRAGNPIDPTAKTLTFRHLPDGIVQPRLVTAISTGPHEVVLAFSQPLGAGATNPLFYRISSPELGITGVTLANDGASAALATTTQANVTYTITVSNVQSLVGGFPIDPAHDTATFAGRAPADTQPPSLVSAVATGAITILLNFSEPIADDAAIPANFSFVPPLEIVDAALLPQKTQLVLTTKPIVADHPYVVTAANVFDRAEPIPNAIDPNADSALFIFTSPQETSEEVVPVLLGVVSIDNTHLVVSYSKAMGDQAIEPSRYVVVQENVNPEVGALAVTNGTFRQRTNGTEDRTTVILTTRSQNEVTYRLTAVGVRDSLGQPLATKTVIQGVLIEANTAIFPGTPPLVEGDFVDKDGDGLYDFEEQRGWVVTVDLYNGREIAREVTSNPDVADTDGDGLNDGLEKSLVIDPRDADTDDDGLRDGAEFNEVFSDPTKQDSDDDDVTDGLEFTFFDTSPLLADTDGDQILDGEETLLANRDARLADLPLLGLEVGDPALFLDTRFVATSTRGTRQLEAKTVTSTLTHSTERTFTRTHRSSYEGMVKAGVEVGLEFDIFGPDVSTTINFETQHTWQTEDTWSDESKQSTQQALEQSRNTEAEVSADESVERRVEGARMNLGVTLMTDGNVSFTLSDVEITALLPDPRNPDRLLPIASLAPDSTSGVPNTFSLGPLNPARGPVLFTSTTIFPSLVEDLMADPRGLIFSFGNFTITDEFGRNFAFTQQDINDRTAVLDIDYGAADIDGDGIGDTTERHRVATLIGRIVDTNGDGAVDVDCRRIADPTAQEDCFDDPDGDGNMAEEPDRKVIFDANGDPVGITIRQALEDIVGLEHVAAENDAALKLADPVRYLRSYSTRVIQIDGKDVETLWRVRGVSRDFDDDPSNDVARWEVLTPTGIARRVDFNSRILNTEQGAVLAFVEDRDGDAIEGRVEFAQGCSDAPMIGTDSDGDGLRDSLELFEGWTSSVAKIGAEPVFSSCGRRDTDADGLTDNEELFHFVDVGLEANGCPANSTLQCPVTLRVDIDRDGRSELLTATNAVVTSGPLGTSASVFINGASRVFLLGSAGFEPPARRDLFQTGLGGRPEPVSGVDLDAQVSVDAVRRSLNPRRSDSDRDGIVDAAELFGYTVDLVFPFDAAVSGCASPQSLPNGRTRVTCATSALNPDHDGDLLTDGAERKLGLDPTISNPSQALDTDGDGLVDFEETILGWTVSVQQVSNLDALKMQVSSSPDIVTQPGPIVNRQVTSAIDVADTDGDGLSDKVERDRKLDPRSRDTDADGLEDGVEIAGYDADCGGVKKIFTNALDADSDDDGALDGTEIAGWIVRVAQQVARRVTSCPLDPDTDLEGLPDGLEFDRKLDPRNPDTDGDESLDDRSEYLLGLSPLDSDAACVRVQFVHAWMGGQCGPGDQDRGNFETGSVRIQRSNRALDRVYSLPTYLNGGTLGEGENSAVPFSSNGSLARVDVVLKGGDQLILSGSGIQECDGACNDAGEIDIDISMPVQTFTAPINFTSGDLISTDWSGTGPNFSDFADCQLHVRYTLRRITDSDVRTLRDISCQP